MQAHVRPEEAAVVPSVEASSAGERLDAALAADQAHRAQLQAKWEARYEQARRRAATVEWCAWAVAQAGMGICGLGVVAEAVTKETPALFFPGWIGLVILGLALLLVGMLLGMVCPALQAVPRKLIVLAAQQDNVELKPEGTGRAPGSRSSWR